MLVVLTLHQAWLSHFLYMPYICLKRFLIVLGVDIQTESHHQIWLENKGFFE
jgi:hypothetical protein